MSDAASAFCCGCGGLPPNATCVDWVACAPQSMRLDYTIITRLTKTIHGGISYVVSERVARISGDLTLIPSEFRLRGTCEVVVTTLNQDERTPVGGEVQFSYPPCQTCNGCPSCDACCEDVGICSTVTCRRVGTAQASVRCGTFGTEFSPTTVVDWDGGSFGTATGTCTSSGCWPCEGGENGPCGYFDPEASCANAIGAPYFPGGFPNGWTGCVEDGDGLDVFNANLNRYESSTWTQNEDPYVAYYVTDVSLGYQNENPLNIVCFVGPPSDIPSEPVPWNTVACGCSSTYFQEEIHVGSLVVL